MLMIYMLIRLFSNEDFYQIENQNIILLFRKLHKEKINI